MSEGREVAKLVAGTNGRQLGYLAPRKLDGAIAANSRHSDDATIADDFPADDLP
jgi:hypothetical protein